MSKLTSLAELPSELSDPVHGGIAWQFNTSTYVDQSAIHLNVPATSRRLRMAGFGGLIVQEYFGDTTEFTITDQRVMGVNEDGSAEGTATGVVSKAETEKVSIEDDEGLFPAYRRPTATLTINRNELASRLSDRINNKGQEQDEAWAAELDRSLRRGILQAAYKKLRHDAVNETEPYWTELAAAFTVYGALGGSPGGGAAALGIAHFTAMAMRMTAAYENRGSCRIPEFRPSISPGDAQPDRCLLVAAMLLSRRLIHYRAAASPSSESR